MGRRQLGNVIGSGRGRRCARVGDRHRATRRRAGRKTNVKDRVRNAAVAEIHRATAWRNVADLSRRVRIIVVVGQFLPISTGRGVAILEGVRIIRIRQQRHTQSAPFQPVTLFTQRPNGGVGRHGRGIAIVINGVDRQSEGLRSRPGGGRPAAPIATIASSPKRQAGQSIAGGIRSRGEGLAVRIAVIPVIIEAVVVLDAAIDGVNVIRAGRGRGGAGVRYNELRHRRLRHKRSRKRTAEV